MKKWPVQVDTQIVIKDIFPWDNLSMQGKTVWVWVYVHACLAELTGIIHTVVCGLGFLLLTAQEPQGQWLFVRFNWRLAYSIYTFRLVSQTSDHIFTAEIRAQCPLGTSPRVLPAAGTQFLFTWIFFAEIPPYLLSPCVCAPPSFLDRTSRLFLAQFCLSSHFLSPTVGR